MQVAWLFLLPHSSVPDAVHTSHPLLLIAGPLVSSPPFALWRLVVGGFQAGDVVRSTAAVAAGKFSLRNRCDDDADADLRLRVP
jgi:hypothetical protein